MGASPKILGAGAGRALQLGPTVVTVKAGAEDTDDTFSLVETEGREGSGPPMHVHRDAVEAFYVLEGDFDMYIGADVTRCGPGTFVLVPRGVAHTFRVRSTMAKKLNLYAPAAMIGYFEAMAEASAAGRVVSGAEQEGIAAHHHMQVLGPLAEP